jgi:hypothetical protein
VFKMANFLGNIGMDGWGEFNIAWADVDLHDKILCLGRLLG